MNKIKQKVIRSFEEAMKIIRERKLQELLGDDENEKIKVKQNNRNTKIDELIGIDENEKEPE